MYWDEKCRFYSIFEIAGLEYYITNGGGKGGCEKRFKFVSALWLMHPYAFENYTLNRKKIITRRHFKATHGMYTTSLNIIMYIRGANISCSLILHGQFVCLKKSL